MAYKHGGLSSYSNLTKGMDTFDSLPHFGVTEMLIGDQDDDGIRHSSYEYDLLATMDVKSKSVKHIPPIKRFDAALLPHHADVS